MYDYLTDREAMQEEPVDGGTEGVREGPLEGDPRPCVFQKNYSSSFICWAR